MEHNNGGGVFGFVTLSVSWMGSILAFNITLIPIILSAVASAMACVNYYYQIRKNRKDK